MSHDIIDNRRIKLSESIRKMLSGSERAKLAVGYFFLSGFEAIQDRLNHIKEVRLLMGNASNHKTIEELARAYKRLNLIAGEAEKQTYHSDSSLPAPQRKKRILEEAGINARDVIAYMDQTDENEALLSTLARMIEEKRLKVKVYTKGNLHAKVYIFDYGLIYDENGKPCERHENGIAIVGSSNLSLSGISDNTELNVVVSGNDNHQELTRWFNDLWDESADFEPELINEISGSWALAPATPYDIYMKTLYNLLKDRLESGDEKEILWTNEITDKLADFQKVAVRQLVQMIKDYGGAFASDVVGMGKSYIGAAVLKQFAKTEGVKPLIICPASLVDIWELYNAVYSLNAQILSMGMLEEKEENINFLLRDERYNDRKFILIDESHHFRNRETQRYQMLQGFLNSGDRKVLFLTATPKSRSSWDVYSQIKLFHPEDKTDLPINPPDLKKYFKGIEDKLNPDFSKMDSNKSWDTLRREAIEEFQYLVRQLLVRRTRLHILKWFGFDAETDKPLETSEFEKYKSGEKKAYVLINGRKQFFPKRELEKIEYSIDDTYQGLYSNIRSLLGKPKSQRMESDDSLAYARYGLFNYLKKEKKSDKNYANLQRAGSNLCGLIRIMLFKRFESSVYAFRKSIAQSLKIHRNFLVSINNGIVPAGDDAKDLLTHFEIEEDQDLLDKLQKACAKYDINDFDVSNLRNDLENDIRILEEILSLVSVDAIPPEKDEKLQILIKRLNEEPLSKGKVIIFSQYADTVQYIYDNIFELKKSRGIDYIYGNDRSKMKIIGLFAPKANPEYKKSSNEQEINLLISSDVLSEGLNLQDCDKIINYDLHWNPIKLIQRFGRIDRIGSENERIWGFNFLPETRLDANLGLREKLQRRIQEIHDMIGEDSPILDKTETINEDAIYAIYNKKSAKIYDYEEEEEYFDLSEAEEILRQLRAENPEEFGRIVNMRDGIRSGKGGKEKGFIVFCGAGRYLQLSFADSNGDIISKDITKILSLMKCSTDEKRLGLPKEHNRIVNKTKLYFDDQVKIRESEKRYSTSLTQPQRYILRELGITLRNETDEDKKNIINVLEDAFRKCKRQAVLTELSRLRKNAVKGKELISILSDLYHRHSLDEMSAKELDEEIVIPKIICSESIIQE